MSKINVVGLGYIGLPTALMFASHGVEVVGTDYNESLVATLSNTPYDTGLDLAKLDVIAKHFNKIREEYLKSALIDPKVLKVDVNTLRYQVPGGMLSNLISQLKMAGKSDKLDEVLEEVAKVREDAGFPPLVTPTSQIVGTQAVNNVIFASEGRYSRVTKEFKGLVRGEYGKCPAPVSDEFRKKIIGDDTVIDYRPADKIAPEIDSLRERVAPYQEQDEDLLSLALFEQVAVKYFDWRKHQKYNIDSNSDVEKGIHTI